MTDIKTLAALFIAGSAFTACSSDDDFAEQPENPAQKTYTLTINASKGDDAQTRALSFDGSTLNASWVTTEKVYVYNATNNMALLGGYLQPQTAGASTTLTGELTGTVNSTSSIMFRFPRPILDYSGQVGTLEDIAAKYDYAEGKAVVSSISGSTINTVPSGTVTFTNQQAIVKFTLIDKASGNAINPTKLTIAGKASDQEDGFEVNKVESTSTVTYGDIVITPSGSTNVIYAALRQRNPGGNTITLTAETASGDIYTYTTPSRVSFQDQDSKYGYNEITVKMVGPCISGKFSVSSSKQVYFSKGNLQATTSDLGATWTWAFATNQWDKIGAVAANTSISDNKTVSTNGTVDLFGWSTDGTYLGINNNTINSAYSGDFVDWGSHADVIAGIGTGWRTLTSNEWRYLLATRTTTSNKHYCKAQVNGVAGVILLPDDWSTGYYTLNKCDVENLSFNASDIDKISLYDWNHNFVPHGAVFLPTTGQRDGSSVTNDNGRLYYWSATGSNEIANQMYIAGNAVYPDTGGGRHFGNAIRLVHDVK